MIIFYRTTIFSSWVINVFRQPKITFAEEEITIFQYEKIGNNASLPHDKKGNSFANFFIRENILS
jgi:hypothetical protein